MQLLRVKQVGSWRADRINAGEFGPIANRPFMATNPLLLAISGAMA